MNKKFSTLVAAFALTAFAGNAATTAQTVDKLDKDALKGMYQLHDASNNMLVMHGDSLLLVDAAGLDTVGVSASLWCVQVTEPENQGQNPIFDFTNKKTGKFLAVSAAVVDTMNHNVTSGPIAVGVNYQGWGWSKTYENKLEAAQSMYTYVSKDSVVYLTEAAGAAGRVGLIKLGANESAPSTLKLTLKTAADVVLTEPEINAYLAGNKDVLTFTPDYKGTETLKNPFSTVAFRVDSVNKYASGAADADDYGFMLVKQKSDSIYLRVDTAWANASGEKFLKFNWTSPKADDANVIAVDSILSSNSVLKNQHKFKFTYSPSVDSVFIQVREVRVKADDVADWSNDALLTVTDYATNSDTLFVKLQDLIKGETRIVTIGQPAINTKISFGVTTCVAADDLSTSIDDGVYYIRNNKGQYLASPLNKNGKSMEWVTVEAESRDVAHMPAFQWVVLKDQTNPKLAGKSPISIYNREYAVGKTMATASQKSIQLYQNAGSSKYYTTVSNLIGQAIDSLSFDLVPAESVKDSLLGYKNIEATDLMVYKYQLNYFHSFNSDKFVAKNANDSILGANNEKGSNFTILDGKIAQYGYAPSKDVRDRIKGLVPLFRTEYRVVLDKDTLVNAKEDYYAVGAGNYNGGLAPYINNVDSFFFKENNHYNDKHYYAIVRAQSDTIGDVRVGVDDQVLALLLKVQSLTDETRVSSFAIERSEEPLYRRFNNTALKESATDGPDSLRFFESVRKEYLMDENNREGGLMDANVNYLGMWTADKATGLAFRIDTARVTRGAGYIKPQYFISVDRRDFAGKDAVACEYDHNHTNENGVADKWTCSHAQAAIPGFERGKYLVSFADSLSLSKNDKPYADGKNGYTRVGFVEAIRVADTLWVLPADFRNLANDKIDFDALNKANKALVDAGKIGFKNIVKDDRHHNYTWSFRYLSPEKASNEQVTKEGEANRFLIESMNAENNADPNTWIAPNKAQWLKIQNGCVVLTRPTAEFNDAALGVDGALRFNVENEDNDELATDNEAISTSEVTVIAQNGAVRIANAEGKKVVITNILGQTVANTVITSSDATIAAPAGVVVVAVEGEEAVKAIVK